MNLSKKWFLSTWFICFVFMFSFYIIPVIIGIVLLVFQYLENKDTVKKYGSMKEIDNNLASLNSELEMAQMEKQNKLDKFESDYKKNIKKIIAKHEQNIEESNERVKELEEKIESLNLELNELQAEVIIKHYNFSDYNGMTSEDCKNKLSLLIIDEQNLIKNVEAAKIKSSFSTTKAQDNNNIKRILRCFNSECENIISNITVKNIDSMRSKITKSFEGLNKLFEKEGVYLTKKLLEYKLKSLNLIYTYELKKEQEREQQKAIKEQMIEEEKVRREIEKAKAKLDKDYSQFSNEINKLITYMQKTQNDVEKQLYIDKIKELEERLKGIEKEKEDVLEREANARAGFVYIISNIGSFGENIYKIGMTRRLEPMDRIKELSSASVPFEFDVHAMIFSPDAPSLETSLHHYFEKYSVNKINPRKEFFKISIDDIEAYIKENYNSLVEFTKIPVAHEYRQSLQIAE